MITVIPFLPEQRPVWLPKSPTLIVQDGGERDDATLGLGTLSLYSAKRKGFPRIMNDAMNYAFDMGHDYAMVWNSDAWFANDHDPYELEAYFADPNLAAVGPAKEIHGPDRFASGNAPKDAGDRVCSHAILTEYGPAFDSILRNNIDNVIGLSYCPLYAVRLEAFLAVGGFDTSFSPGFFEDADLWRKFRLAGWKTIATSHITYFHGDDTGASKTFKKLWTPHQVNGLGERNRAWFLTKWGITPPPLTPLLLSGIDPRLERAASVGSSASSPAANPDPSSPSPSPDCTEP